MRSAAVLALLACAALAQGKAPPTVEAILVKPAELPKNVRSVEGVHAVSPQARTYFETPAMKDIMEKLAPEVSARMRPGFFDDFPVPTRKECQSFQAEGRKAGSVFVYEYAEGHAGDVLVFLQSYIWGDARSEQHPEEIVIEGRLIWVLSFPFPAGDPAAEWYKDRLRKKFRVRAFRERPELASLRQQIVKAFDAKDAAGGIRVVQQNAKATADWSLAQNMLGQFAAMKEDHALAEKAYRKALHLHDSVADPLEPRLVWVTVDGLAIALHAQGKRPEAVKLLQRALTEAAACGSGARDARAQSLYNLACAYSMMKKYPEALGPLREAIDLGPPYREAARTDADFAEARKLKEFQELLAPPKVLPLSLDAILVKPDELPANVRPIEGMHTREPHPRDFYETPSVEGIAKILPPQLRSMVPKEMMEGFPVPKRKEYQSFVADGGEDGTVFVFEYETDDLSRVTSFLESVLWGEGGPSEDHPEEIIAHGRILWVISFPRGDPAAEWYKERLRKKFRVPAQRSRAELAPIGSKLADLMGAEDLDGALRLLRENAQAIEDWSFGQCMIGKLTEFREEYAVAEAAYRKALALHEGLSDPMDPRYVWLAQDGLGVSLRGQGKVADAVTEFGKAVIAGKKAGDPAAVCESGYNLAAALAVEKDYENALKTLQGVIRMSRDLKERAREDPDFAEARKRPEFQELLK